MANSEFYTPFSKVILVDEYNGDSDTKLLNLQLHTIGVVKRVIREEEKEMQKSKKKRDLTSADSLQI